MAPVNVIESGLLQAARLARCTVDAIVGEGEAVIRVIGEDGEARWCDVLTTGAEPPELSPGDVVLVWHPGAAADRGVVLGRIGASRNAAPPADAPDELVIEAKKSLTLRVGDGSITIRGDGKILIKGKDLVSHAQRTNRIKGGAVAIN